jgi:D-alanyl-D-alanine-carboxypeptidase/D-alanyl-D-alanine-endopeptidase
MNSPMRMTRRALCVSGALAVSMPAIARALAALSADSAVPPSETDIHKLIADRVDTLAGPEDGIGIVAGIVEPRGRRIVAYGHFNQADPRAVDGNTIFEIGSITKIFTALLLVDFVQKREVNLSDPASKYLSADLQLPVRDGKSITLLDLATHTSGLPFMPPLPDSSAIGAAGYSAKDLYGYLANLSLPYDIGTRWDYSNLGYWLLSEVLAARGGDKYERLLLKRIINPLGMTSTAFVASTAMKAKFAIGHYASMQPADSFLSLPGYAIMAAAGGLLSSVDDLLIIPSIATGYRNSSLAALIANCLASRRPTPTKGIEQALGWTIIQDNKGQLIFRDGGTFGHSSAMIWDPTKRIGVVVLSNHVQSVSDLAHHMLRANFPLDQPTAIRHNEISLNLATLKGYEGRYEVEGEGVFELELEGKYLTFLAPADWGLPKLRLHAESQRDFFANELPLLVTVQLGNDGRAMGLVITPPRGQHAMQAHKAI